MQLRASMQRRIEAEATVTLQRHRVREVYGAEDAEGIEAQIDAAWDAEIRARYYNTPFLPSLPHLP